MGAPSRPTKIAGDTGCTGKADRDPSSRGVEGQRHSGRDRFERHLNLRLAVRGGQHWKIQLAGSSGTDPRAEHADRAIRVPPGDC